ncbi:enoyl-CoA hydratase [Chromatiales bacterium (ex Bugula neritina AB1)]|nr:enoyl-CoA hydratase [Chromatiales bacterium (ex Bugula neritina AB1)]
MMKLPAVSVLELSRESHWLTIWFNQPEKRNPLTDAMREELVAVLDIVRQTREIRGITLRGRGGVFCAGGDLKSFRSLADGSCSREEILAMSRDIGRLLEAVNTMPQVVVAVVEGAAMAGGFGLACCADIVLCEKDAKFAMTETAIGLSPAQIAPYVIQKLGYATARKLMLTAAGFNGEGAFSYGFADELACGTEDLENLEARLKKRVAGCAPGAIAETKTLLRDLNNASPGHLIEIAADNFADRVQSPEALEGINSFFDKRKPSWAELSK